MTREEFIVQKYKIQNKKLFFQIKAEYNNKTVHCFFEGNADEIFYRNYIETIFEHNFFGYICKGKIKVESLYLYLKKLNWYKWNKNRLLFFRDKDLDDIANGNYSKDENIFETKYYSIENYFVDKEVFRKILKDIFKIRDKKVNESLLLTFKRLHNKFYEQILFFSSMVAYTRVNNINAPLENVKISEMFEITFINDKLGIIFKDSEKQNEYFIEKTKINDNDIFDNVQINKIQAKLIEYYNHPKEYIRGKFELCFLIIFFKFLNKKYLAKLKTTNNIKFQDEKIDVHCTDKGSDKAIERFLSKVKIPIELKQFLQFNYNKR